MKTSFGLIILLSFSTLSAATGNVTYHEKDGVIAIEAEGFTAQVPGDASLPGADTWVVASEIPDYGGKGYLTTNVEKRTSGAILPFGKGSCAVYEIEVKEGGKYFTAFRGHGRGSGSDSVFITVNDQLAERTSWKGSDFPSVWHWSFSDEDAKNSFMIDVPAGRVKVQLYLREAGTSVDQIILIKDKGKMPAGDARALVIR